MAPRPSSHPFAWSLTTPFPLGPDSLYLLPFPSPQPWVSTQNQRTLLTHCSREIQVQKTDASRARKSSIREQSIEDNDNDSHFFQSHGKQYQDAILPGLVPLWQALCPQMHVLRRNRVNAPWEVIRESVDISCLSASWQAETKVVQKHQINFSTFVEWIPASLRLG